MLLIDRHTHVRLFSFLVDARCSAFTQRFPIQLQYGSVTFKSTRFREWFSERLRPFRDYIPVNYNLSDLVDKIAWAHENPTTAERIALHAREMATNHLRDEDMRCYAYRLMLEYQTLFQDG